MKGYHPSNPVSPDSEADSPEIPHPTPPEPDLDTMMVDHLIDLVDKSGRVKAFFHHLGLSSIDDLEFIATSQELSVYLEQQFLYQNLTTSLSVVEIQKLLRLFKILAEMDEITIPAIRSLTVRDLKSARRHIPIIASNENTQVPVPDQTTSSIGSSTSTSSASAKAFCSSVKKNFSDYPELSHDNLFLQWHSSFLGLANIHEYYDILDPASVISDFQDPEFKAKSEFAFTVFRMTLKSPRTITLVTTHNHSRDACALYADLLLEFSKENPHAELSIKKLKDALGKTSLDGSWKRSCEAFFNTFTRRVATLEKLMDKPVDEEQKLEWLKDGIRDHIEFNRAYVSYKSSAAINNHTVSFKELFNLLHRLSIDFDAADSKKATKKQAKAATKTATKASRHAQQAQTQGVASKPNSDLWIDPAKWAKMTPDAKKAHAEKVKKEKAKRAAARQGNVSTTSTPSVTNNTSTSPSVSTPDASSPSSPATTSQPPGTVLTNLLSSSRADRQPSDLVINGQTFRPITRTGNHAQRLYRARARLDGTLQGSLVDGGCNGGLAGSEDVLVIDETFDKVNVEGIAGTGFDSVPIGSVAGLIPTKSGPIIGFFHQYALCNRGTTIHSPNQLRSFGNVVDDVPKQFGGGQVLQTHDGFQIPLSIRGGLPYLDMTKPTPADLERYPHVTFTSDAFWNPESLDHDVFHDPMDPEDYDAYPDVCYQDTLDGEIHANPAKSKSTSQIRTPRGSTPHKPNFEALRP